jgi:hypothetical protein
MKEEIIENGFFFQSAPNFSKIYQIIPRKRKFILIYTVSKTKTKPEHKKKPVARQSLRKVSRFVD